MLIISEFSPPRIERSVQGGAWALGRVGQLVVRPGAIVHLDCIQVIIVIMIVMMIMMMMTVCRIGGGATLPGAGPTTTRSIPQVSVLPVSCFVFAISGPK